MNWGSSRNPESLGNRHNLRGEVIRYPFNSPSVERNIIQVETCLRNLDREIGYLFDKDGNVVLCKEGTETELQFTPDELAQGVILTHYHTDNDSFTQADLLTGIENHYSEIRAVTERHLYIARFPEHYKERGHDLLLITGADESSVPIPASAERRRHAHWEKAHYGFFYFCTERDSIDPP